MPEDKDEDIGMAFELQSGWCARLGSPYYAGLMAWCAQDWRSGGALRELLPSWPGHPGADLLALRVAGALHGLVLQGLVPSLAAHWPPARGDFDPALAGPAVAAALRSHPRPLADYLASAPQTNEVARSAVLLGGFALVAQRSGLPLAVREIGASAGLNMLWHRYAYALGSQRWGAQDSPVRLHSDWQGQPPGLPRLPPRIAVHDAEGSDLAPVDLGDDAAALRLTSYVWPDQQARLQRLRSAIALARESGLRVERADAADWVQRVLAQRPQGATTVLAHTIVWQYLPQPTRLRIVEALQQAGAAADAGRPLAWLRLEYEPRTAVHELRLTIWPGGEDERLAQAHPHGEWVRWGEAAANP